MQWLRVVLDLANSSGRFPPKDRECLSNLVTLWNIFLSSICFVRDHYPKSRWKGYTNDCVNTLTTRNISQDENGRGKENRVRRNRAQRASAKPSARPRYSENAKQDRGIQELEKGLKIAGVEQQLVDLVPTEPTSLSLSATNAKTPPHPKKRIKPPRKEHQSSHQHNRGRA